MDTNDFATQEDILDAGKALRDWMGKSLTETEDKILDAGKAIRDWTKNLVQEQVKEIKSLREEVVSLRHQVEALKSLPPPQVYLSVPPDAIRVDLPAVNIAVPTNAIRVDLPPVQVSVPAEAIKVESKSIVELPSRSTKITRKINYDPTTGRPSSIEEIGEE